MVTKTLATIGPITENRRDIRKILTYSKFVRTNSSHNTILWHKKVSDTLKSIDRQAIHLLDIPGITNWLYSIDLGWISLLKNGLIE